MNSMIKQMQNIAAQSAAAQSDPVVEMMIPIDKIVFDIEQPRQTFYQVDDVVAVESQESLQALADTLKTEGLIQPIVVEAQDDGNYRLVAGERRTRAAKILGWKEIRATVRHNLDIVSRRAIQIVENVQREELSEMDIARFIRQCVNDGMSQKEVATRFGKPASWVNDYMKWLDPVLNNRWVASGLVRKAYMLAEVSRLSEEDQQALYERVTARGAPLTQADVPMIRQIARSRKTAGIAEGHKSGAPLSAPHPRANMPQADAGLKEAFANMGIPVAPVPLPAASAQAPVWPDAVPGQRDDAPVPVGADAAIPPTYPAGGSISSAEARDSMAGQTTSLEAMSQAVRHQFAETVTLRMSIKQLHALTQLADVPEDMDGAVQMTLPAALVDELLKQMGEVPEGVPILSKGPRLLTRIDDMTK